MHIYGENRPVIWETVANETRLWGNFSKNITDWMAANPSVLHAHSYSVSFDTYNSIPKLKNFMRITQSDVLVKSDGQKIKFINSYESEHYPMYATMYHPEYQNLKFEGRKKWNLVANSQTDEIAFRLSLKLNRDARMNKNKPNSSWESLF